MSTTSSVSGASGFSYTNNYTSTVTNPNGSLTSNSFLQMLMAELQNQDPLNTTDTSDLMNQTADLDSVTGINDLNSTFSSDMTSMNTTLTALLLMENTTQAASLIGKNVTISTTDSSGNSTGTVSGTVSSVNFVNGQPQIMVNGTAYGIASVTSINAGS